MSQIIQHLERLEKLQHLIKEINRCINDTYYRSDTYKIKVQDNKIELSITLAQNIDEFKQLFKGAIYNIILHLFEEIKTQLNEQLATEAMQLKKFAKYVNKLME